MFVPWIGVMVPQEITDCIIDILAVPSTQSQKPSDSNSLSITLFRPRQQRDALAACTLVCKTWLPRSSQHLFRALTLSDAAAVRFAEIAERTPRIAQNVHTLLLRWRTHEFSGDVLRAVLAQLPALVGLYVDAGPTAPPGRDTSAVSWPVLHVDRRRGVVRVRDVLLHPQDDILPPPDAVESLVRDDIRCAWKGWLTHQVNFLLRERLDARVPRLDPFHGGQDGKTIFDHLHDFIGPETVTSFTVQDHSGTVFALMPHVLGLYTHITSLSLYLGDYYLEVQHDPERWATISQHWAPLSQLTKLEDVEFLDPTRQDRGALFIAHILCPHLPPSVRHVHATLGRYLTGSWSAPDTWRAYLGAGGGGGRYAAMFARCAMLRLELAARFHGETEASVREGQALFRELEEAAGPAAQGRLVFRNLEPPCGNSVWQDASVLRY